MENQLRDIFNEALEIDNLEQPDGDSEVPLDGYDTHQTAILNYTDTDTENEHKVVYEISVVDHPGGDFALIDAPNYPVRIYQLPIDDFDEYIEDTAEKLYQRCKSADV